jgi:hypothetical protein
MTFLVMFQSQNLFRFTVMLHKQIETDISTNSGCAHAYTTNRDVEAKDKFMKLMGAKKPENEVAEQAAAAAVATHTDYKAMQHNLEREFHDAIRYGFCLTWVANGECA